MVNESLINLCLEIIQEKKKVSRSELISIISDNDLIDKLDRFGVSQFAWHVVNNSWDIPKCLICNKPVSFQNHRRQYAKYCCKACAYSDPARQQKISATMEERYGVSNAAHSAELIKKKKETINKLYGVDHPSQCKSIKEKKKLTMQQNWGVDNPSQSKFIQNKKIETNRRKRGVSWPTQDPLVQETIKNSNLSKYGSTSSLGNSIVRSKGISTIQQKYGVDNPQQNIHIRSKTISTNIERYGVDAPSKNLVIKDKIRKTNIKKYGSSSWFSSDEAKIMLPLIHKSVRGVDNPSKDPSVQDKIRKTFENNYGVPHINYIDKPKETIDILTSEELFSNFVSNLTVKEAAHRLGVNESTVYRLSRTYQCRSVMDLSYNSYESKITDLLDEFNIPYQTHCRNIIEPFELDIYLPDYKIAIEVGSMYWHGEQFGRTRMYHYNKWKNCKQQGITLFQYFDQDINEYWSLTRSKILRAIKIPVQVIGARLTEISHCSINEERDFLNKWHVKGFSNNRNTVIAAKYNNKIAGIMTIQHSNNIATIDRWATDVNYSWPGLFSRCLTKWIKISEFSGEIRTWCDNRLGDGRVYNSSGFVEIDTSKPGYWYFRNNGLENRVKYQKHKLSKLFQLTPEQLQLSEWEIMQQQGYDRIWDAGHTLWCKIV